MTLDQLRDWHAFRAGWTQKIEGEFEDAKWCLHHHSQWDHPFPATLDAADASFPPEWYWQRSDGSWWAGQIGADRWKCVQIPDSTRADKIRDLYELSKLAWEQEEA